MFRFVFVSLFLLTLPSQLFAAQPKTNLIFFLVDDMGWMDCTPYGSQYYVTPNMQKFSEQGMRFTDAYAQPLCSPTRASILTGQYSSRHGITSASGHQPPQAAGFEFIPKSAPANQQLCMPISKNYLEPAQYTLAEALRDAGYQTAHIGKWHLGLTENYWPEQQGFSVAFHAQPSPGPPGNYFSPYGVSPAGTTRSQKSGVKYTGTITDGPPGEYITDRLTDESLKFIEANKDKPFYLNLWHHGVHGPWGHKEAITAEMSKLKDPTGKQDNPVMASMLKSVDESLGRIMQKLDELKISDHTLFIFYSDNGGNVHSNIEEDNKANRKGNDNPTLASYRKWAGFKPPTNNAPLREGKGRIYEGGIRVPLMVRWPEQVKSATTSHAVVGPIDMYPTVLDALKIQPHPEQIIDGVSFLPVLKGEGNLQRKAYFTWFPHLIPAVSVRAGDWKLIRRFQPHKDYPEIHELYNLKNDLSETHNLAAQMPEKVAELNLLIDEFVKNTGALYPVPNPDYKSETTPKPKTATTTTVDGLVERSCKLSSHEGYITMTANGKSPFLGTAQLKASGLIQAEFKLRAKSAGAGKIHWKSKEQTDFPESAQQKEFALKGTGDWETISFTFTPDDTTSTVRIYLPANNSSVDIASMKFTTEKAGKVLKFWDFSSNSTNE